MGFGKRLKAVMDRHRITQKEVAERAHMSQAAVSQILRELRKPTIDTAERLVDAARVQWGEVYSEQRMLLSAQDATILREMLPALRESVPLLERILANDATQKQVAAPPIEPPPPRRRRRKTAEEAPRGSEIRDSAPIHHEVHPVANGLVPEWALRLGATRPYTVHTDAMIGAGILEKAVIYVRPSVDLASADGQVIVCTLNRSTYLKRLDLRGGRKVLENANPRYAEITVTDDDDFSMIGVVVGF